jgi:hypothetical protein
MPLPADKEVSFRESVNLSCDLAMATLDIPEGMAKYIRNVNNVYQVRFRLKSKERLKLSLGGERSTATINCPPRAASVLPLMSIKMKWKHSRL